MPTFWTRTLIPTARQVPAEAEVPSHQLMLRAGLIRKIGSGIYDYLPLGLRALHKAMAIVRDEMNKAGAVEVLLPALTPMELFEKTGRHEAFGDNLLVVTDRHGRVQGLGPTHEEVVTELAGAYIESYKQLPITLYQIQTKFRDEFRPRFGVLRSREFQMKDAYSFHDTVESLNEIYDIQYNAYCKIFDRCGIPYEIVEAQAGPIGGSASHEFMVPSPTGEDIILKSDKGNYAANVEKCEIGEREYSLTGDPTGELEKVHTPDCSSIEDVCAFFKKRLKTKLKQENMLKTLVYSAMTESAEDRGEMMKKIRESQPNNTTMITNQSYYIAVVRGDHEVNEDKLRDVIKSKFPSAGTIELAHEAFAEQDGFTIGYVGPDVVGKDDIKGGLLSTLIVDHDAAQGGFWVTGANEADHHVKHFNWKRDVVDVLGDEVNERLVVAEIRNAMEGDPSPKSDGGVLHETKGIEIGHVFKLGTKYSERLGAVISDKNNEQKPMIMGCYGIGVNRILAAAIEREGELAGHDENGIIWPASIAPYQVIITPIKYEGEMKAAADRIAAELEAAGHDVLLDDRDERPGVKFKDADLIGIPLRITIGDKALKDGNVEIKPRTAAKAELVAAGEAAGKAGELLAGL